MSGYYSRGETSSCRSRQWWGPERRWWGAPVVGKTTAGTLRRTRPSPRGRTQSLGGWCCGGLWLLRLKLSKRWVTWKCWSDLTCHEDGKQQNKVEEEMEPNHGGGLLEGCPPSPHVLCRPSLSRVPVTVGLGTVDRLQDMFQLAPLAGGPEVFAEPGLQDQH